MCALFLVHSLCEDVVAGRRDAEDVVVFAEVFIPDLELEDIRAREGVDEEVFVELGIMAVVPRCCLVDEAVVDVELDVGISFAEGVVVVLDVCVGEADSHVAVESRGWRPRQRVYPLAVDIVSWINTQ